MKKITLIILVISVMLGGISCKKTIDETIDELIGTFTATIQGETEAWEAGIQAGALYSDKMTIGATSVLATDSKKIFLYINGTTTQTYDLSLLEGNASSGCYYIENKEC